MFVLFCARSYVMDSLVTINLHHHGDFGPGANTKYIGGQREVITEVDTNIFSFRDLDLR